MYRILFLSGFCVSALFMMQLGVLGFQVQHVVQHNPVRSSRAGRNLHLPIPVSLCLHSNNQLSQPSTHHTTDITNGSSSTESSLSSNPSSTTPQYHHAFNGEAVSNDSFSPHGFELNVRPLSEGVEGQVDPIQLNTSDHILNAIILACAFGYAVHTILDVDHGMTRGWTQKEIVLRMPYDNWRNYENSLASSPIWTKTTINVIIYLLGDWLSQTVFNKKHVLDFDAARTFKNGFIGMCFGPLVAEYYEFSDWILPAEVGINRLYKIFMDQTLYLGIKCSIYIAAVTILNGEDIQKANETVRSRIKPVMFTAWKFWPFVHCITYGFIPAQHRILWVNSVDLVWNAILAALSRGTDQVEVRKSNDLESSACADSESTSTFNT